MANLATFNQTMRLENTQKYLDEILQDGKREFVLTLTSLVANNTALQACEPVSIMYAALKATSLKLPIDQSLGNAAIIPYNDKKSGKTLAQFQIMVEGWKELLRRTGQVLRMANEPVYEGELITANRFRDEYVFDETKRVSDNVIGYLAYIKLTNGFEKTVYWPIERIRAHAKRYSQTYRAGYGVWNDNFEAMALKTVMKHLIVKYCPKSIELQRAIDADQSVSQNNPKENIYIDNLNEPENEQQENAQSNIVAAAEAIKQSSKRTSKKAVAEEPAPVQQEFKQSEMSGANGEFDFSDDSDSWVEPVDAE